MKANELMLGDWVRTAEGFARVLSIAEDGIYFKDSVSEGACTFDFVFPIPLTPEILEKNGFSKSRLMGEQRHFTYYLAPSVSLLAIYDADFSLKIGDCARYIKYVHELQHALRLCGIEKGIVL